MKPIYRSKKGILGFYWAAGYRLQAVVGRLSYGLLIVLSVLMMFHCRASRNFESRLRTFVFRQLGPFLFVAQGISTVLEECQTGLVSIWSLNRRNKGLAKENADLRLKLFEFDVVKNENHSLRELLNFTSRNRVEGYGVKKISILNTRGMTHSIRISLSEVEATDLSEHDMVLDRYGNLIGRVVNVAGNAADILLVSDYRSKIPANLESSRLKVILGGNGTDLLNMEYFFNNGRDALLSENVYSSNDGDLLQEGMIIGKVVKNGKKFSVKLNSDLNLLDLVLIVYRKKPQ